MLRLLTQGSDQESGAAPEPALFMVKLKRSYHLNKKIATRIVGTFLNPTNNTQQSQRLHWRFLFEIWILTWSLILITRVSRQDQRHIPAEECGESGVWHETLSKQGPPPPPNNKHRAWNRDWGNLTESREQTTGQLPGNRSRDYRGRGGLLTLTLFTPGPDMGTLQLLFKQTNKIPGHGQSVFHKMMMCKCHIWWHHDHDTPLLPPIMIVWCCYVHTRFPLRHISDCLTIPYGQSPEIWCPANANVSPCSCHHLS